MKLSDEQVKEITLLAESIRALETAAKDDSRAVGFRATVSTGVCVTKYLPDRVGVEFLDDASGRWREALRAFAANQRKCLRDLYGIELTQGRPRASKMSEINPPHYTWHPSGVECHTIAAAFPYNIGVAIAYLWRHERKGGSEDLKKAIRHIEFEIERRRTMRPGAAKSDLASILDEFLEGAPGIDVTDEDVAL